MFRNYLLCLYWRIFMTDKDFKMLVEKALEARKMSYSPYSGFSVGAALLGKSGKIYSGCNIENASYTPTICAERTAVFKAVSEGEKTFDAIAVVCGSKQDYCYPCGVCRQVMTEFFDIDTKIILANVNGEYKVFNIDDILPFRFDKKNLTEK